MQENNVGATQEGSSDVSNELALEPSLGKSIGGEKENSTRRRKRKDTGQARTAARPWTEEEERLFTEALTMFGRDWKQCAEHIGSRDHRAVASHAQKYLIKMLLQGEELPERMAETGRGYTLSGKPLDPNSSAARAYGLRREAFQRVVDRGILEVGVHVTTTEMLDTCGKSTSTPKTQPDVVKSKKKRSRLKRMNQDSEDDWYDHPFHAVPATEYSKNRPRRQVYSAKAQLGSTTESLELTEVQEFIGPVAGGAPLAQPFSVSVDIKAIMVMDFHAHLSISEVIGLFGGRFDPQQRHLTIVEAFPCRRAADSDSGTSVELDAESQVEVMGAMEEAGLVPVGWYHSHPVFQARPSVKDNENQRNYQALCREPTTGLEPWVGAIISPYDQSLPTEASDIQFWMVKQQGRPCHVVPYEIKYSIIDECQSLKMEETDFSDIESYLVK